MIKYVKSVAIVSTIGIAVFLGMQSIDRAAPASESRFFWLLFPGLMAGWVLSGGHEGTKTVAYVICWIADTGMYWLISMLLSWMIRKLGTRPT